MFEDNRILKTTHPQKYYLKMICKFLYILGQGNCWYEEEDRSKYYKTLHLVWSIIANAYIMIGASNEGLAYVRSDLTVKERNDSVQFFFAHSTICGKVITLLIHRKNIIVLLKRMLEDTRSVFSSIEMDKQSMKKAKLYCVAMSCMVYFTASAILFDGIRGYFSMGLPIRTEVTLYPSPALSGTFVNILRVFVELHLWFSISTMILIDCLCVCCLIIVEFKFKDLHLYFNNLRELLLKNPERKDQMALEADFKRDFVTGIKLHVNALWCANKVQSSLGLIYSVQIFQSISLLVMCLVKLVSVERNLMFLVANAFYIMTMITMTGSYMTAAGDVTHEASVLSTSIFHCGWELIKERSDLRVLVVVAIQRSQEPIYMKAFGVYSLTYSNFISVIRSSYSFFAVMY